MNGEANGTTEEPMDVSPIKEEKEAEIEKGVIEKEKINETHKNTVTKYLDSECKHSKDGVKSSSNNVEFNNGFDHQQKDTQKGSDHHHEDIKKSPDHEHKDMEKDPEDSKLMNGNQSSRNSSIIIETKQGDQNTEEKTNKSNEENDIKPNNSIEENDTKPNNSNEENDNKPNHIYDELHTEIKLEDSDDNSDPLLNDIESKKAVNLEDKLEEDSDHESHIADTVSIHSDSDELSQDNNELNKSDDVIILENESLNTSEIHEIESENDCIVTNATGNMNPKGKIKMETRRSARSSKRVKYDDDYDMETGSDVELIPEDPLKRKSRQIFISDTKKLVDIAAKQGKIKKKEPTMVIIDNPNTTIKSSTINANLYQSIVARGTTVTPVKMSTATQASQTGSSPTPTTVPNPQPKILPSLTDDMFVVEAPSFIVPYVYEKPALKPFREFVDKLGKELEDQKEKEVKEQLEKKKQEKAKREQERKEKRERGEEVESSGDETENLTVSQTTLVGSDQGAPDAKKKNSEKKERRRRKKEDDDVSWDGSGSDISDDDETLSDEETAVEVIKEKSDTVEDLKTAMDLSLTQSSTKTDNYFDCSLGKFFTNIGINLVKEYVQTDLIKQQTRKLHREKKTGHSTKEREITIGALTKNLELSKETNEPYKHPLKKCKLCSFKTESDLVMENHLQTPHMKNNMYRCNFCPYEIKNARDIIFHIEAEHNVHARLERAVSYHQCPNCTFEDNGKGKLGRHLIACAKKFKPEQNQAPPLEWEPPAKIPKLAKGRNNIASPYSNNLGRPNLEKQMNIGGVLVYTSTGRARGKQLPTILPRGLPIPGAQIVRSGVITRQPTPIPGTTAKGKSAQHPSISITPLPRQPTPISLPTLPPPNAKNSTFVICEICDGYIKDLEQLRNHMQWIHKVKIHPKMIYNRPPLNCQKCQFRFFTDQGLERHLLGSHGLVTSSMQEAANKGKDAGRCPVCGRVYQWKLLNHVARDHNLTLKPAHLSYKCTVCTATFGMYKQFENHVYSAHSVVAKRVMDKNKPTTATSAKTAPSAAKSFKINDEITITPQPASSKNK